MKFSDVVKEVEKHTWWSEEGPGVIQHTEHQLRSFITQSNVLNPKYLSITIMGYTEGFFFERTPADEKYKVHQYVCKQMKKDKNYLKNIFNNNLKKLKRVYETWNYFDKNKDSMSNEELGQSYVEFNERNLDYMAYCAGIEFIDIFTDQYLVPMMRKELPKLSTEKFMNLIITLTAPRHLSFMEEERLLFLKICLNNYGTLRKIKTSSKLQKQLDKLSKKYFHVLNNFKNTKYLDSEYFLRKCKEEVRKGKFRIQEEYNSLKKKIKIILKEKKRIYKEYDFSEDTKINLLITETVGEHIDFRKSNMIKINYLRELYLQEAAKRFNMNVEKLKDYTFEEVQDLLSKGKKPSEKLFEKRFRKSVFVARKKGNSLEGFWFYGKEAEILLNKTFRSTSKEIKGQVASAPIKKLKGTAQVIMDITKENFKRGNILVTSMTRPEFVPLMRKAAAIVTDEGGITCHAAILSRELKIPCIIGTKVATRILKSGDRVEMDLETGLVKKL
ncbi:MAG: PEP-utilizing enzyme [archaeon]